MSTLVEVNEGSTQLFTVVVKNDSDVAVVPTVATYTLTDRDGNVDFGTGGAAIEDISITPSVSMTITLSGNALRIADPTSYREYRLLTIKTDRGDAAKPENIEFGFWVINLKVASTTLWTPASEALTVAWYDGNDATTVTDVAGVVSQWDDKSGNDYHLNQVGGSPVYYSAQGLILFDGIDDALYGSGLGAITGAQDLTIIAIYKMDTGANSEDGVIFQMGQRTSTLTEGGGAGGNDLVTNKYTYLGVSSTASPSKHWDGFSVYDEIPIITGEDSRNPWIMSWQKASADQLTLSEWFKDGTSMTGTPVSVAANTDYALGLGNGFCVGASSDGETYFDHTLVSVYEIIVVNDLDAAKRQKVEGYIAWKWGWVNSLPVSHPYKLSAPII